MARRHESLIPLSHQHQHALALAVIIRRRPGIEKGEPAWREEMVSRIREAHRAELNRHFEVEETVLFPEMERHLGPLALVTELFRDHASLHGLIRLLEASATFPLLDGFSALLEGHIRREERQLFAEFERRMPADEARTLGKQIKARLAEVCPKP
jgi:hemerythrin-like domain-containing protein